MRTLTVSSNQLTTIDSFDVEAVHDVALGSFSDHLDIASERPESALKQS